MNETKLKTGRRGALLGRLWSAHQSPGGRGVFIAVHGLGDHGGHFRSFADFALTQGWAVASVDLYGHGHSPGRRGHADSYEGFLSDVSHFRRDVHQVLPGPQILLGHSMGGNLLVNYVLRRHEMDWSSGGEIPPPFGLALLAPMLLPSRPMTRKQVNAAWITGHLFPWFRVHRRVEPEKLTDDKSEQTRLVNDPLRHSLLSIYLGTQLLSQGRHAIDQARQLDVPTVILVGDGDELIDLTAVEHTALRSGGKVTLMRLRNGRHDLLHGSERDFVEKSLCNWADNLAPKSNPIARSGPLGLGETFLGGYHPGHQVG